MPEYRGPAGEVETFGNRTPFDPASTGSGPTASAPRAPDYIQARDKIDPTREFRRQEQAWRQTAVYVGDVSSDIEVGIGYPPVPGCRLRGVGIKVRSTHSLNASNYWSALIYRIDEQEVRELIAEYKTEDRDFKAQDANPVYHQDGGVLFQPRHEATVKFEKTGSPSALSQVTLYADWYVGIGGF